MSRRKDPARWRPMDEAQKDGTTISARRQPEDAGQRGRRTWWGKDNEGRVGWCLAIGFQDIELWFPDEWRRLGDTGPL